MNLEGFVVMSDTSVFNPDTGVEYRARQRRKTERYCHESGNSVSCGVTMRWVTRWYQCVWYYKEIDFYSSTGVGRSSWSELTVSDGDELNDFVLSSL